MGDRARELIARATVDGLTAPGWLRRGATRLRPGLPVVGVVGLVVVVPFPFPTCLFRLVLGIPCPGCGLTRAVLAALRLDFAASLHWHPLGLALIALGTVIVAGAFALDDVRWKRLWVMASGAAGAALMVVWALRFAGLFGGPVPV